jgi:hypothetical protein
MQKICNWDLGAHLCNNLVCAILRLFKYLEGSEEVYCALPCPYCGFVVYP